MRRSRSERFGGPPSGRPWFWLTTEMVESDAFGVLRRPALFILFRLMIEHASQGGRENGNLIVTYDQFVAFGVSRKSIAASIRLLKKVGFLDVTMQGLRNHGAARRPSHYRLTWLPDKDRAPASNRWRRFDRKRAIELFPRTPKGNATGA